MTSTVIFSEHCERPPGQITTCDAGAASYVHGIVGDTADFLPDGVGGMLVRWRRVTSVSGDPNTPHALTFTSEPRLSRVVDDAVDFDIVVGENEHTQLIGGGGTAFVRSATAWHATDVATWTATWSNSNLDLEPVMGLVNGGIAVQDLTTGLLHELDAAGAAVNSGAFGGRWGYQSALGLWTAVDSSLSPPRLSGRVSLPVSESETSFRFLGEAVATGQNAIFERSFPTRELAAIFALEHIYPVSRNTNAEWGGLICQKGGRFIWSEFVCRATVILTPLRH